MEIITSNKDCEKLCYNGYMYVLKHFGKSKITWRCSKRSSFKCMGKLYTNVQKEDPVLKSDHNHFGDSEKVDVEKALCIMKEQSKSGLFKPLEVYAEGVAKLNDHVKRTLRNQCSKLNPIESTSLDNLTIDNEWCTTGHPEYENLLIFDNGVDSEQRILIFGTVEGMNNLSKSSTWYLNGNFALAPKLFLQL
ncbi:hypothetical protein QTP88_025384 [Uroleucon formosanum]